MFEIIYFFRDKDHGIPIIGQVLWLLLIAFNLTQAPLFICKAIQKINKI